MIVTDKLTVLKFVVVVCCVCVLLMTCTRAQQQEDEILPQTYKQQKVHCGEERKRCRVLQAFCYFQGQFDVH